MREKHDKSGDRFDQMMAELRQEENYIHPIYNDMPTIPLKFYTDDEMVGQGDLMYPRTDKEPVLSPPDEFKTITLANLLSRKFNPDWLIKGYIEKKTIGMIFGTPECGKSLFVQDMAFCIAQGIDFKGQATKKTAALYVCGEGFSGLNRRFKALVQHYGCIPEDLHFSEQPASFMDISSCQAVADAMLAIGNIGLVIIDTFHRNMGPGDENSAQDFAQFMDGLDKFIFPLGPAIIVIHHVGHVEQGRGRGSSAMRAAWDFEYKMERTEGQVLFSNTKMKDYDKPPDLSLSFSVFNLLDDEGYEFSDEDGDAITGAVLESSDEAYISRKQKAVALTHEDEMFLKSLSEAINIYRQKPPLSVIKMFRGAENSVEKTPTMGVSWDDFRPVFFPYLICDKKHRSRDAKRILKKLTKHGKCMFYEDFLWL